MKGGSVSFPLIVFILFLAGCSGPPHRSRTASGAADPILRERISKDEAFKSGSGSPIPPQDRASFRGLEYFPIDPGLRFTVRLQRYSSPKQVRLGTNTGEIRSGLRYGYFDFRIGDRDCRLRVYRLDDTPGPAPYLFIPFRDATSGRESYGAGRYMDLNENTAGIYELDFNRAYNPFCAYNNEFSCPLPLEENTLKVAIRAGEKDYISARKL